MTAVNLKLAFSIAMRELRAGAGGLTVFVMCIALGVAAVAAIGSLAASFDKALAQQGRTLVGGDLSIERVHQPLNQEEREGLDTEGALSASASLRAMARTDDAKSALIEVKAVDANYPLFGEVAMLASNAKTAPWQEPGVVLAERALLDRLDVEVGSRLTVGETEVTIGGLLGEQPDRLADRLAYGPRVLMSLETLERTGLVQPGSIVRWIYRLKLGGERGDDRQALRAVRTSIVEKFPQSGFEIRDWTDPAPSLRRDARRFTQFIGLVGLTALLLGGIGVGAAIGGYMGKKREIIATFKTLGASSSLILSIYLVQTLALAVIGIALGLGLGALAPLALASLYGDVLPIALATEPHPVPLIIAALAGLLTLALFVLWPLGKAARVPAAVMMRAQLAHEDERPASGFIAASAVSGLLLFAVAIAASQERAITAAICAGIVAAFAFFFGFGWLLQHLAARFRRTQPPALALALASIAGPGSLARSVAISLGAGLGLLVAVALIQRSLTAEMQGDLKENAPAYYFLDVDVKDLAAFRDTAKSVEPDAKLADAPMLRGRIVAVKGVPADEADASPDYRWVLSSDRGITYSEEIPEASEIVAGKWWPKNYSGPPLVSFDDEAARGLGLSVGDTVTVNILGRNVEARVASRRRIDWESLAINFVMVFSPNTLEGAPHRVLTTLGLPEDVSPEREGKLIQALAERFPLVTAIKVGDIIDAAKELIGRVMTAISATAGFTLLIGAAVLASAVAAGQQRRKYQAVLYKTLGATRTRIVSAELIEFGLLGFAVAIAAVLLATVTAYALCRFAFEIDFAFSPAAAAGTVLLALALVLGLGAIATWRVLSAKAATYLREA